MMKIMKLFHHEIMVIVQTDVQQSLETLVCLDLCWLLDKLNLGIEKKKRECWKSSVQEKGSLNAIAYKLSNWIQKEA